ncbi:MAG: hypothetical protein ACK41W_10210 [Cyanobacteriota bacterium]|jgi:hypothetical protein
MSFKNLFEEKIEAEGADCRTSYDQITGVPRDFTAYSHYPVQIEITGRRFPDSWPDPFPLPSDLLPPPHQRYPQDYSGGWWDIGHISHYTNLNEPVPSYGINLRDLAYGAAGVAAGFLPLTPPAAATVSVLHFMGGVAMTMSDFSRTGFIDLGSLAVP